MRILYALAIVCSGFWAQTASATVYKCELNTKPNSWVTGDYQIGVTPSKSVKIIDSVIHEFNGGNPIVAEAVEFSEKSFSFTWRVHANNQNGSRLLLFTGAIWTDTLEIRIDSRIINGSRKDGARGKCVVTKP